MRDRFWSTPRTSMASVEFSSSKTARTVEMHMSMKVGSSTDYHKATVEKLIKMDAPILDSLDLG